MNELSRHIEILLLNNDCVIVPGFGGFVAHHRTADYVVKEEMFFPPQRTLGFNPQLQLNDSLLIQSYAEAYDMSYPEAMLRIETEVEEIKQEINVKGSYEFQGIGTVNKNSDGHYSFEPCVAGLLTPSLYALNTYVIGSVEKIAAVIDGDSSESLLDATSHSVENESYVNDNTEVEATSTIDYDLDEDEDGTIKISIDTLKYIAAAAVILFLFVLSCLPLGKGSDNVLGYSSSDKQGTTLQCSIVDTDFIGKLINFSKNEKSDSNSSINSDSISKSESSTTYRNEQAISKNTKQAIEKTIHYSIVMASKVSEKGAKEYVSILKRKGYNEAFIYKEGTMRRVVYGSYESEKEANEELRRLRNKDKSFDSTWVQKFN